MHQEPGKNSEIKAFAASHGCPYSPTFNLFAKSTANDPMCTAAESDCSTSSSACCAPNDIVYNLLRTALPGELDWNFAVFLVNKQGVPVKRYASTVWANPSVVTGEIDALLAA